MTSKKVKSGFGMDVQIAPKTPHEEIMFCIESTNDIVSDILELLKRLYAHDYKMMKKGFKR